MKILVLSLLINICASSGCRRIGCLSVGHLRLSVKKHVASPFRWSGVETMRTDSPGQRSPFQVCILQLCYMKWMNGSKADTRFSVAPIATLWSRRQPCPLWRVSNIDFCRFPIHQRANCSIRFWQWDSSYCGFPVLHVLRYAPISLEKGTYCRNYHSIGEGSSVRSSNLSLSLPPSLPPNCSYKQSFEKCTSTDIGAVCRASLLRSKSLIKV